jgi:hypothetical protein
MQNKKQEREKNYSKISHEHSTVSIRKYCLNLRQKYEKNKSGSTVNQSVIMYGPGCQFLFGMT